MPSSLGPNGSTWRWRQIRQLILERDGYRCQECGAPGNEVDHKVGRRWGGTDHPDNLQVLCAKHHAMKGDGQPTEASPSRVW